MDNINYIIIFSFLFVISGCIFFIYAIRIYKNYKNIIFNKSEFTYRKLVESFEKEYFFYSHNTNGTFTYISPSIKNILGYSTKEFKDHYGRYMTKNQINDGVVKHTELSLKGEKQPIYNVEIFHKDGSIKLLEVNEFPVFDKKHNVIAIKGIAHDISERVENENKIKESKEKLRAIFEHSVDAIGVYSEDIQITVNPAYIKLFGYDDENEIIGKSIYDFIQKIDETKINEITEIRLKEKIDGYTYETKGIRKDGTLFDVNVHLSNYISQGEKNTVVILRDVTEKKNTENNIKKQFNFEMLLSQLSAAFINISCKQVDNEIEKSMKNVVEFLNAGRMGFAKYDENKRNYLITHSYTIPGYCSNKGFAIDKNLPWYFNRLNNEELFILEDLPFSLPEDAIAEREYCEKQGIKTLLAITFKVNGKLFGNMAITNFRKYNWDISIIQRIRIIGEIFINSLIRKENEEQIEKYKGNLENVIVNRTNELKVSEQRLSLALETTNTGLWEWNIKTGKTYFNNVWYYMLGYVPGDFPASYESWRNLLHPDDRDETEKLVKQSIENEVNFETEFRIKTKNGDWKWILAKGSLAEKDKNGKALCYIGIHVDITERKNVEFDLKKAKEEAERANHSKEQFLSNMSHELRTPLNAILGFSNILTKSKNIDKNEKEFTKIIYSSGQHLLSLINDILDMSRIKIGKVKINPHTFNILDMLHDIETIFILRLKQIKLNLNFKIDKKVPKFITTDQRMLRQILINILDNAVKFTKEGGIFVSITIEKKNDNNILLVKIEDTGRGISKDDLVKIFNAFETFSKKDESNSGTGLGLTISKQFAKILGGDLIAKSVVHKGTTFELTIPILEENIEPVNINNEFKKSISRIKGVKKPKILIVDDVESNRELLVQMLRSWECTAKAVKDGDSAVALYKKFKPDLIFMDLLMPKRNGFEMLKEINKIAKGKNVVVIAITASVMDDEKKKALSMGFDNFITKPIIEEEIAKVLEDKLQVQFEYTDYLTEETTEGISSKNDIVSCKVPEKLIKNFYETTLNGDVQLLKEIISQVSEYDQNCANNFEKLLNRYDYDALIEICEKTLSQSSI